MVSIIVAISHPVLSLSRAVKRTILVGCPWNFLDEPILKAWSEPVLTALMHAFYIGEMHHTSLMMRKMFTKKLGAR